MGILPAVQTQIAPDGSVHAARRGRTQASPLAAGSSFSDNGLVHRDLKPANAYVVNSTMGAEAIRVIDFGIAKEFAGEDLHLTQANMVVGTMLHLPPEPLLSKPFGPPCDLCSLGLVLYRCLFGHVSFMKSIQRNPDDLWQTAAQMTAALQAAI